MDNYRPKILIVGSKQVGKSFITKLLKLNIIENIINPDLIFVVYDITDAESFEKAKILVDHYTIFNKNPVQVILIGNKLDLKLHRQIKISDATDFSRSNNMYFIEISAKTGENFSNVREIINNLNKL